MKPGLLPRIAFAAALLSATVAAPLAAEQKSAGAGHADYPTRPVRLIVPFPPGGGSDAVAQMVSQHLFSRWDNAVVVDNRGGAGGTIGTEMAARATPDGYTLAMATASTLVINPILRKVGFDPMRDFDPVIHTASVPVILIVPPSVPAKSAKELIALAKSQPGKLNYASSGEGTVSHLAAELFKSMTGTDMVHVPYRGGGPARNAVLAGQVQLNFANLLSAAGNVKAGKLRALGVSTRKRARGMPEVPTLDEAGVSGFEVVQWNGIIAPRGTPRAIIAKVNADVNRILDAPEVEKLLLNSGAEPEGGPPERFAAFVKADIAKWTKVIRDAKIKPQN